MIVSLSRPSAVAMGARLDRYDDMLAAAFRAEGEALRRSIVGTATRHLDSLPIAPLARALALGSVSQADAALDWQSLELELEGAAFEAGWGAFGSSAEAEASHLGMILARRPRRPSRAALSWAAEQARLTARRLGADRGGAILAVLRRSSERGLSPAAAARLLLRGGMITLDERGVSAVVRYLGSQVESGAKLDAAFRRAEAYARRLMKVRAETISRTEMNRAHHAGLQEAWDQARSRGMLDGAEVEWRVRPTACPICSNLDGERVPVGSAFSNGLYNPPMHPRCQCTLKLIRAPRGRLRGKSQGNVGLTWAAA